MDVHTKAQRSYNMSRIRGKDTAPERRVRALLHHAGLRYRLQAKELAGKPDIVFRTAMTVVFVHGCFWHMHRCRWGKPAPATNADFWANKRRGNKERDERNRRDLRQAGWKVFTIWECDTRDEAKLARKIDAIADWVRSQRT